MGAGDGIRAARADQVEEVLAVHGPILGLSAQRARELVVHATARGSLLVHVAASGQIDGYVLVEPQGLFGRDLVKLLVVASSARRRGIGAALLSAAVHASSTSRVFTSTNASNAAMRALLDKGGWQLSGTLSGVDPGDDEVVYYRDARAG